MKRWIGTLAIFFASVAGADIADLPVEARAALEVRAEGMTAALVAGDEAAMFDFMPPPILARLAALAGRTQEEFRALLIDNPPEDTGVSEFRLDLAAAALFHGSDGETYALIPTESLAFDPNRGRFRVAATTIGIRSGDTWHFVTIGNDAVLSLLVATYPALAGAEIAPATLTDAP